MTTKTFLTFSLSVSILCVTPVQAQEISVRTLLPQMTDLSMLARRPKPSFTMAQASSYDRHSTKTDQGIGGDPFANGDAGQFVRIATLPNGHRECVLADLKGPGAVVRVWSANPSGIAKFYFDGETTPRFSALLKDLLTGKVAPFTSPIAYEASQGTDLYFPFPYEKSLRIAVEEEKPGEVGGLYYHVGYRTYAPGTTVQTFQKTDLTENARAIVGVQKRLGSSPNYRAKTVTATGIPAVGKSIALRLASSQGDAICALSVSFGIPKDKGSNQGQMSEYLRHLALIVECDGEKTVNVPLGDFFASATGLYPFHSLPIEVTPKNELICRFVMPYHKSANVRIEPIGKAASALLPVTLKATVEPFDFTEDTLTFHAAWSAETVSTRPFADMNFLDAKGEGQFVGVSLSVGNPVPEWWGEGDEKVYVDGEVFPSTFGTGTEDYFGYAWCSPLPFARPYHAQTQCDGPGNFGNTAVCRWHVFDPIPFTRSLRFDMERWSWADVSLTMARTVYWYARPGGSLPVAINTAQLALPELKKPEPVPNAIEGETMEVVSRTGGNLSVQEGFWQPSGAKQRWWTNQEVGDTLIFRVPVKEAGTYHLIGNFCYAADYGIHRIRVNGNELPAPMDFYGTGVNWKRSDLGTFTLPAGDLIFTVECVGRNPQATHGNMFGLDYLLLEK